MLSRFASFDWLIYIAVFAALLLLQQRRLLPLAVDSNIVYFYSEAVSPLLMLTFLQRRSLPLVLNAT